MTRAAGTILVVCVLAGCSFGVPVKEPTVVPQHAAAAATIRLGESTRADVRAALGEPWLHGDLWRVEVYRADDKRTEVGFIVAVVVPVPVGAFHEKRHGYVLVTYDPSGRVSKVASGAWSEGMAASTADHWLVLRADGITLAVDPVGTKRRTTLLADAGRLPEYLGAPRDAAGCVFVTGCGAGADAGCPDRISIDGAEPFDATPITVLCAPDAPCPKGAPLSGAVIDGKRFFLVPVLHAIDVDPGPHRLQVASSERRGGGEATFDCDAGRVLHGVVRGEVVGASFWSKGTLAATMAVTPDPPEAWNDFGVVLFRDGRWLVRP